MHSVPVRLRGAVAAALACLVPSLVAQVAADGGQISGERIPAAAISPLVVQTMADVIEREKSAVYDDRIRGVWNGEDGRFVVPPMTARTPAHSGDRAIVNEWGDPRIGIGFGRRVDVTGAWLAGHGVQPAATVVIVGYRDGVEVARTDRITLRPGEHGEWSKGLEDVDRIEFLADRPAGAMAFFALDDLAFRRHGSTAAPAVLDFEDLDLRAVLTGSGYAGLDWELGTGLRELDVDGTRIVHAPASPLRKLADGENAPGPFTGHDLPAGTPPAVVASFAGPQRGDPGGGWIPPDTCGAVGPDHFVSVVNANLSVWRRTGGARLANVGLNTFFGATVGDPRAAWDPHGQRFVVLATDFSRSKSVYIGVTRSSDPTGTWYTFSFRTDQGSDAGRSPDYPTLGVDARGIYTAAYMVGSGALMTIWAMPTAPLYQAAPATPPITAYRSLRYEGAIQPCVTYGDPGAEYLVSRSGNSQLRLRRLTWSGLTPSLFEHALPVVPRHGSPPNAPALGSTTPISTIDYRPMNAVYRNGSVWTAHGVASASNMAAVRWYELSSATGTVVQYGTIEDSLWHYYYGSIAVDARGDMALGFSGSHAGSWVNAYVTARLAGDPPGETAPPIEIKAGEGSYERVDGSGRNRWGDYSLTSVDPVDDVGFWSIQEYPRPGNTWATWIARVGYESFNYGAGLAGTGGVPALGAAGRPVLGTTMPLAIGNSSGQGGAAAVLAVGVQRASTPLFGGTLLVQPIVTAGLALASPQTTLPLPLPLDPAIPGHSLFLQVVQVDALATQGLAFTRGLELRPVCR